MSTKAQLEKLNDELRIEAGKVPELEKKLASTESNYQYTLKQQDELRNEVEEIHILLDGFENCPREVEDRRPFCTGNTTLSPSARFVRYLQSLVAK